MMALGVFKMVLNKHFRRCCHRQNDVN